MKKAFLAFIAFWLMSSLALAGDRYVNGYYRDSDGDGYRETYVNSYRRTEPNHSRHDNYSTQGNYNPYTGERGTENPYQDNSHSYNRSLYGR